MGPKNALVRKKNNGYKRSFQNYNRQIHYAFRYAHTLGDHHRTGDVQHMDTDRKADDNIEETDGICLFMPEQYRHDEQRGRCREFQNSGYDVPQPVPFREMKKFPESEVCLSETSEKRGIIIEKHLNERDYTVQNLDFYLKAACDDEPPHAEKMSPESQHHRDKCREFEPQGPLKSKSHCILILHDAMMAPAPGSLKSRVYRAEARRFAHAFQIPILFLPDLGDQWQSLNTMRDDKSKESLGAMSTVFLVFVGGAILTAAATGRMKEISDASFQAAKDSVSLAISLIGIMALWLGLVRILEVGGFMHSLAKIVKPVMIRLFPDVPEGHPAMSAMVLNISANMLGLGNAATPLGIKAMTELNRLNPLPGTATNAMCLFVALHTSSITLFPLGTIGVRAAAGAANPANIFLPTLLATMVATVTGCTVAIMLAKRDKGYASAVAGLAPAHDETQASDVLPDYSSFVQTPTRLRRLVALSSLAVFLVFLVFHAVKSQNPGAFLVDQVLSFWLMPVLMLLILTYGLARGVKVYEAVTDGAKQGFEVAVRIIPFLVAILVGIAMFRASGAMDAVASMISPFTRLFGMPPEVLPMALVRPLSGSGAFAVMSSLVQQDPNSYSAYLASVIQGAMDTTFYTIAVYFGAVKVSRVRHAIFAGLTADIVGIIAACLICSVLWQA